MDQYVVNITDEALADMDALYEHIAKKLKIMEIYWKKPKNLINYG